MSIIPMSNSDILKKSVSVRVILRKYSSIFLFFKYGWNPVDFYSKDMNIGCRVNF